MNTIQPVTRKRPGPRANVLSVFCLAAGLMSTLGSCFSLGEARADQANGTETDADVLSLERAQKTFRKIAETVVPVVVSINVNDLTASGSPWDFFFQDPEEDEGVPRERDFERYGMGSGIIVEKKADTYYILTNNHVIKGGKEVRIVLSDKREFKANVAGVDERKDMALLSFQTDDSLPVARLGDSDTLRVGDWVIAVGNPYGWSSSVTSGIISALGRRLDRNAGISNISDFIQTDAGINPGNSGGALVNLHGQIIGINTWITSPTGGSIGIGFAIPINNVKKFIQDIVTAGKLQYGWVGVSIARMINQDAEKELGLSGKKGAFVNYVIKQSPAWKAGILPGDFIAAVNGQAVIDESHFIELVSEIQTGMPVTVTLIRLGKEMALSFVLAPRPPENAISSMSALFWPGFVVLPLSGEVRERYKITAGATGVVVTFVEQGTPGFIAGLHAGDIVTRINATEIRSMTDFYRALNEKDAAALALTVARSGGSETIQLVP